MNTVRKKVVRGVARLIQKEVHPAILAGTAEAGGQALDIEGPAAIRIRQLYQDKHGVRVLAREWREGLKVAREQTTDEPSKSGPKPSVTTARDKARTRAIRFDQAHWDQIVEAADSTGVPPSEWVRRAARHALECALATDCQRRKRGATMTTARSTNRSPRHAPAE